MILSNVCLWHEADMPLASVDVRFREQSGHGLRTAWWPLMTQSGQTSYDVLAVRRFEHNQEGACLLAAYMGILGPSGR
jgi:hypothetical protein